MGQLASVEMRADLYIIPLCKIHYVLIHNGNSISKSNICGKLHERRNCRLRKTYVMSSPCPRLHSFAHLCEPLAVFSLHHTLVSGVGLERERDREKRGHTGAASSCYSVNIRPPWRGDLLAVCSQFTRGVQV